MNTELCTPELLESLRLKIENQNAERLEKWLGATAHNDKRGMYLRGGARFEVVRVEVLKKYAKVIRGTSVAYFVDMVTGIIYASNSWRAPNLKRSYGTLATTDTFNWGDYNASAIPGSGWHMEAMPGGSGYARAVKNAE